MPSRLDDLLAHITRLEGDVEEELTRTRATWRYQIEAGRVRFEQGVRQAHRRVKQSIPRFIRESSPRNLLTAPIIYGMVVPIAIIDIGFSFYQLTCFPIYGIARVRRARYVVIDRQHLGYLNIIEKLNCVYCGYANGVLAYVREIAARTEQYWCPIRHATRVLAPHDHYRRFVDYGDAEGYQKRLLVLRNELKKK
ncbi:MAG: hypothetical protein ABUS56_06660 [Acidobacteriota bacterium]